MAHSMKLKYSEINVCILIINLNKSNQKLKRILLCENFSLRNEYGFLELNYNLRKKNNGKVHEQIQRKRR